MHFRPTKRPFSLIVFFMLRTGAVVSGCIKMQQTPSTTREKEGIEKHPKQSLQKSYLNDTIAPCFKNENHYRKAARFLP